MRLRRGPAGGEAWRGGAQCSGGTGSLRGVWLGLSEQAGRSMGVGRGKKCHEKMFILPFYFMDNSFFIIKYSIWQSKYYQTISKKTLRTKNLEQ